MKNIYLFIESTMPNKNGHVSHLMKWDGKYYSEISLATGKYLTRGLYFDSKEQIERFGYKILDVTYESPTMTGYNRKYGYMIWDLLKEEL